MARKTIALVEDNPDNRLLVQVLLEDLYDLVEYDNGRTALDGIRSTPPDLVLLDISLPEMDGVQVLRALRTEDRFRELPVIALTAHASHMDRDAFMREGFDEYITKPITDEGILLTAIERQLSKG
jgi:CheY-like chemotaxis protein